ncbi:hypothetical protein [Limnofasciculus baicalensis]|uniref:Uncharacterized protein n=1 Tax=Limnofasciculus baicalensis BBK-W-15 TaxID=2699891 RepID=A0AAE3GWF3_9CYAN|nr:hypothetical protein [Limnofasciculus baicalensis]MCP2729832.1 hypothetical protein [Limnofasciculus baicalensis BBK-W-15]
MSRIRRSQVRAIARSSQSASSTAIPKCDRFFSSPHRLNPVGAKTSSCQASVRSMFSERK